MEHSSPVACRALDMSVVDYHNTAAAATQLRDIHPPLNRVVVRIATVVVLTCLMQFPSSPVPSLPVSL